MNKSIITIPLYYTEESDYDKKWEERFRRIWTPPSRKYSEEEINEKRMFYSFHEPKCHRFNDILGYAELVLDAQDILIYYHLNGDRQKKYNPKSNENSHKTLLNRNRIYLSITHSVVGGSFKKHTNGAIRNAIEHSLEEIEKQCLIWKIYVNLIDIRTKSNFFDFKAYFNHMKWFDSVENEF